jgi:hypothetical protein
MLFTERRQRNATARRRREFRYCATRERRLRRRADCKFAVKLPLIRVGALAVTPTGCENFQIGWSTQTRHSARPKGEVMPTVEMRLREDLRNYAVELRQLAYTLPLGVGEHDLLQLSDRMRAAAEQLIRKGA